MKKKKKARQTNQYSIKVNAEFVELQQREMITRLS